MGKPATAYFCANGHLLEDNPHGCCGKRDEDYSYMVDSKPVVKEPCPICGDTVELMCLEWGDDDYPCGADVPIKPIGTTKVEQKDNYGNTYYVDIPIFDVSILLEQRKMFQKP
jgi:hypothetical protein